MASEGTHYPTRRSINILQTEPVCAHDFTVEYEGEHISLHAAVVKLHKPVHGNSYRLTVSYPTVDQHIPAKSSAQHPGFTNTPLHELVEPFAKPEYQQFLCVMGGCLQSKLKEFGFAPEYPDTVCDVLNRPIDGKRGIKKGTKIQTAEGCPRFRMCVFYAPAFDRKKEHAFFQAIEDAIHEAAPVLNEKIEPQRGVLDLRMPVDAAMQIVTRSGQPDPLETAVEIAQLLGPRSPLREV